MTMLLKSLLLVVLVVLGVLGFPGGPPSQSIVCNDISPDPGQAGHDSTAQNGNGGYVIATDLPLSATSGFYDYEGGVTYTGKQ